jgi:hypothetical protein
MGHRPDRHSCGVIIGHGTSVWFGGHTNVQKILVIFLLMFPAICQAGTWCLIRDENEYCNFESSEACYSVAAARGGSCRENYKL